MAGEVIREVLVKVKVQTGDQIDEIRKAEEAAKRLTGEFSDLGDVAKRAGKEQAESLDRVEASLKDVRQELESTAREYQTGLRQAENAVDDLIAKERKLAAEIRGRASGVPGAGGGLFDGRGRGRGIGERLDLADEQVNLFNQRLAMAALPVAIVAMAPDVFSELGGAMLGVAHDIAGDPSKGYFTPKLNEGRFAGADAISMILGSDFVQQFNTREHNPGGMGGNDSFFGMIPNWLGIGYDPLDFAADARQKRLGAASKAEELAEKAQAQQLVAQELTLRQQQLHTMEALHEQQETALERELAAIQSRVDIAEQVLAQEQAIYDTAKQQFGMLDAQAKQDVMRIAGKIDEGGVGSLSAREREFISGRTAFQEVLRENAMQSAESSGFKEVAKMLGLSSDVREAKQKLEVELNQQAELKLDFEGLNAATDRMREELEDTMTRFLQGETDRITKELDRTVRRIAAGRN